MGMSIFMPGGIDIPLIASDCCAHAPLAVAAIITAVASIAILYGFTSLSSRFNRRHAAAHGAPLRQQAKKGIRFEVE
ncbi:hypothetical protein GCM10011586_00180 [Silvibacterium dinghuense]|nr:hypothetical protein GCM10011586_00180 [Silvibacterium dinghuense]